MVTEELQVTPVSDWKKPLGEPTQLPSGRVARLKASGMDAFIKSGIIPNSLLEIITTQLEKAQRGEEVKDEDFDLQKLMGDPAKIADVMQLIDNVTVLTFVEPRVFPMSAREEILDNDELDQAAKDAKLAGMLFIEDIDYEDRFFCFNFASGGTRDLEQFRGGLEASVGRVSARKPVASKTKSTGRTTKRKP